MDQPSYRLTPLQEHERSTDHQKTQSNYSPLTPSVAELLAEKYKHVHHKKVEAPPPVQPVQHVPEQQTVQTTTQTHHTHQKRTNRSHWFFTIPAVIIGLSGLSFGVFSYVQLNAMQNKFALKEIELQKVQDDNLKYSRQLLTQPSIATNTATPNLRAISQVPKGFVVKQTTCFTLYIPRTNTAGEDMSCELVFDATIGDDSNLGASVQTVYQRFNSLKEMTEAEKATIQNTFTTEGTVLVGDTPGAQINEVLPNGDQLVHVYVYIPDRYTVGGVLASGFEITKTLQGNNIDKQLEVFYTLLGTWKWK